MSITRRLEVGFEPLVNGEITRAPPFFLHHLHKVKFVKLFVLILVYAFILNVGFVLRDGFSMPSVNKK
jgi:hypothetical protein